MAHAKGRIRIIPLSRSTSSDVLLTWTSFAPCLTFVPFQLTGKLQLWIFSGTGSTFSRICTIARSSIGGRRNSSQRSFPAYSPRSFVGCTHLFVTGSALTRSRACRCRRPSRSLAKLFCCCKFECLGVVRHFSNLCFEESAASICSGT